MGHAPQAALNVGYRPIPVPALRLAGQLAWSADPLSRPRRDLRQRPWAPYYGNPWPMWPRRELRENAWAEFVLVSWPSTGNKGVGARNSVTSCDLGVFVEQASEPVASDDLDVRVDGVRERPERTGVVQCPVRPVPVEMGLILGQDLAQVRGVDDKHPVEDLAAHAADPPFGDRVGPHRQRHPIQMTGTDAMPWTSA